MWLMNLAPSSMISEIDKYCAEELGIPTVTLMERAGIAVADVVRGHTPSSGKVVILAGKGNNGGDGYAAACLLMKEFKVVVYDVFGEGQKTDEGKYFLSKFKSDGGRVDKLELDEQTIICISSADCIVDAIFGTGFRGDPPEVITRLAELITGCRGRKIAIDVPMGVNADNGSVTDGAVVGMDATVALSFIKPGLVSFPAKAYVGRVVYNDLGIPKELLAGRFEFRHKYLEARLARAMVPAREENSSKGSFGRLLVITGSAKYRGAAHLSLSAALRGGVGYVTYLGNDELCRELLPIYPEAIYKSVEIGEKLTDEALSLAMSEASRASAILVGCGSDSTEGIFKLVTELISSPGSPLILDADAINALIRDRDYALKLIRCSERRIILTPHPLEFARLSGNDVSFVQRHRIEAATKFAAENKCIVVLKGAGTVITDGKEVYINSSGSSALSKAGSGDVLAGFLSSVVASGASALEGAALSVYYHGAAADALSRQYSNMGVTPSDLPLEIARQIAGVG